MNGFTFLFSNLFSQIFGFKGSTARNKQSFSKDSRGLGIAVLVLTAFAFSCGGTGGGPGEPPVPEEKPILEFSHVFSTGVTLTWTPPQDQNISSYLLTFRPADGGDPVVITLQVSQLVPNSDGSVSYHVAGLTAETEYAVTLVPQTPQGDWEAIETKDKESVMTNRASKPSTPMDLAGELEAKTSSFTASLTWSPPADPGKQASGQAAAITGYVLYWNPGDLLDPLPRRLDIPDSRTAYSLENWEGGSSYTLALAGVNDQDLEGPRGLPLTLTTPSLASPPGKVISVDYQSQLSDGFTLTWNPAAPGRASSGTEIPPGYKVYLSDSDTASAAQIAVEENLQGSLAKEEITIGGLSENTSYYLVIKSFIEDQGQTQERLSEVLLVTTTIPGDATTAPGAPGDLVQDLSHKDLFSLKVSWQPGTPGANLQGSGEAGTLYRVNYRKSGQTLWEETSEFSSAFVVLTGLEGARDYQIKVKAVNSENKSKSSTSEIAVLKSNGITSIILTKDGTPLPEAGLTFSQTGEIFVLVPQFQTHNFESEETVNWTSSNSGTAAVDNNGTVTLTGEGQAVITAASTEDADKTAQVSITLDIPDLAGENIQLEYQGIDRILDQGTAKIYPITVSAPPAFPQDQLLFRLGDVQESGRGITNPGFGIEDNGSLHLNSSIPPGEYELFINASHSGYSGKVSLIVNMTIRSIREPLLIAYGTLSPARQGHTMVYPLDAEASTQPQGVVLHYALTSRDSQDISGFSIDQNTGTITAAGTSAAGTYPLTVTVSTEDSRYSDGSLDLEIQILDSLPLTGTLRDYNSRESAGTRVNLSIEASGLPPGISRSDLTFSLRGYQKKTGINTYEDIANPGFSVSGGVFTAADTIGYGIYQVTTTAEAQDLGFSGEITGTIELNLSLTLSYGSGQFLADYGEAAVLSLTPPSLPPGTAMTYHMEVLGSKSHESGLTIDSGTGAISYSGTGKPGLYICAVSGVPESLAFSAEAEEKTIIISGRTLDQYFNVFQYETSTPAEYKENPPRSYEPIADIRFGAARGDFSYRITNAPPPGIQISSQGTLSVTGEVPLGTHQVIVEVTKADAYGSLERTLSLEVVKNDIGNNLLSYGNPGRLSLGEERNYPILNTTIPAEAALVYSIAPANPGDSLGGISINQQGSINVPGNQARGLYALSVTAVPGNTDFYRGAKIENFLINAGESGTALYKPDMEAGQDYFTLGDGENPFLFEIQGAVEKTGMSARIVLKNADDQTVLYDSGSSDILTAAGNKVGAGPGFTGAVSAFQGVENIQIELSVSDGAGEFISQSLTKAWGGAASLYGWRDLQGIQNNLEGHYSLRADIDFPSPGTYGFSAEGFFPLGSSSHPFSGSLTGTHPAGGRYRIKDLRVDRTDRDYVGLFGYIKASLESSVVVQDLIFLDPVITGNGRVGVLGGYLHTGTARGISVQLEKNSQITTVRAYSGYAGGLAGYVSAKGLLVNVDSQGNIFSDGSSAGGLAGINYGRVLGNSSGAVTGQGSVGGLAGTNGGEIIGWASGDVTGMNYHVGGLVGNQDSGFLVGYYTEGTVQFSGGVAGGLLGYLRGGAARGYVTGTAVIGSNGGGLISSSAGGSTLTGYSAAGHAGSGSTLLLSNAESDAVLRIYGDRTHSSSRPIRKHGTTTLPSYTKGVSGEAGLIRLETTPGNYQYYDNKGTPQDPSDDVEIFEKTHGTENIPDFNFRQPGAGTPVDGLPEELGDWTWLGSGRWPHLWDTPDKTYFGEQPEYKVPRAAE